MRRTPTCPTFMQGSCSRASRGRPFGSRVRPRWQHTSPQGLFPMKPIDRELGMDRPIQRRDFLNGVAVAIGASLLGSPPAAAQQPAGSYPPSLSGMRGLYPGSFTTAHALRDHAFWKNADKPSDTGERYDLVIGGGGNSGLSSAYFYRKVAGDKARILILDILDDFGGHAKRNKFDVNGRKI